jgi:hypothetical protein
VYISRGAVVRDSALLVLCIFWEAQRAANI